MEGDNPALVEVSNHTDDFQVDSKIVTNVVCTLKSRLETAQYLVDIAFVDAARMQELNTTFRKKANSTDVLSFPQIEWHTPLCVDQINSNRTSENLGACDQPPSSLGDIVVSLEDAEVNAIKIGHDLSREVAFLLIHGLLHLCGHDHKEKAEEMAMREQQRLLLELLVAEATAPLWQKMVWRMK